MMDHERTQKELEEIFQEIQHYYKTFADDALALQERTLQLARELLENSAGREASGMQDTLEKLAERSRGEGFERLERKAGEAYRRVLKGPVDEHHHKIEEAEADLKEADSS
jgi:uncharacterized protein YceH (UPF0502 family)